MTADRPQLGDVLGSIVFDANGLVPAIAQQHDTGEVLMMAWMSREAVAETLATGRVCYWSRSRKALWRKGERAPREMVMRFGPKAGQTVKVPKKKVLKFRVAKAAKDAILGAKK